MRKPSVVLGTLLLGTLPLAAQAPSAPEAGAGAEDELLKLLNTPVTVASKKATTVRESPGVVTLITREEILDSGARDLIDVLRMVPGLNFASDVQGVVGPAMRGMWGYEGKILLLWDGQEMNESLYGTTQFGNHFPVDQIKQIEIIRGPGSSIYGGYAELGVIKVTTLGADDLKGQVKGSLMNGASSRATLHQQVGLVGGGGSDLKLSFGAFVGRGQRSDQDFSDSAGDTYNMKGQADLRPLFFNLGLAWKGLSLRYVGDHYGTTQRDFYSANTARPYDLNFRSDSAELKYEWSLGHSLTLTPRFTYRDQSPWQTTDTAVDPLIDYSEAFNIHTTRQKTGLDLAWSPDASLNLMMGAERTRDTAHIVDGAYGGGYPDGVFTASGTPDLDFTTNAAYAQFQWNSRWVNLTVGARWENNSYAGSSFVPRVAFTKVAGAWHFKLLYAKAFKPPTIENIDSNFDTAHPIVPEKTRTVELEVGRQIGRGILTVNLFDTRIDLPIVYYTDNENEGYSNFNRTGSRGVELEYKRKAKWGWLNASYSMASARNDVDLYRVPGHDHVLLGQPEQKLTAGSGIHLGDRWVLSPTLVYLGRRYGYAYDAAAGGPALKTFDPDLLLNLTASWSLGPLTASAGVFDLLDRKPAFIQAYNADHSPLPGPSRELVLKLRYTF